MADVGIGERDSRLPGSERRNASDLGYQLEVGLVAEVQCHAGPSYRGSGVVRDARREDLGVWHEDEPSSVCPDVRRAQLDSRVRDQSRTDFTAEPG